MTTPTSGGADSRRVVVVTGGGAGIGAAVAEELGRQGWYVVTMDPLVTLDGSGPLPRPEETTAGRIVAAGGAAQSSSASVTDGDAVRVLFEELLTEHGRLDAVINVAGITRPTSFAAGADDDWRAVLAVHVDGYRNVLAGALPIMSAAGRGRILGVTSGSGWRPADNGSYSCAKRAVAALTWQLGAVAPEGVTVNAMSPIAATRMVTAALERVRSRGGAAGNAGLSLGSMPTPEQLGPIGAHLVSDAFERDFNSPRPCVQSPSQVAVGTPYLLQSATGCFYNGAPTFSTATGAPNQRIDTLYNQLPMVDALGHSSYHALQTSLNRRFSRGFQVLRRPL